MKNPTMLYRPGKMIKTDTGLFDYVIVSEDDIPAHIKLGWSLTASQMQEDDAKPTRAELEEKAKELGIKFDGRTSDAKLASNIKAALNGLDKA
jgi:hypothetical protein